MLRPEDFYQALREADPAPIEGLVNKAAAEGHSAPEILNGGLIAGMSIIGKEFKARELWVPDVLLAARNMHRGIEILKPLFAQTAQEVKGKVNLEDGDIIQIALAQEFIFISSDATVPLEGIPSENSPSIQPQGIINLDKRSRRVWVNEVEIIPPLSYSQFQMLDILFDHAGQVVSRSDIITKIWGDEQAIDVSEQALDALVRRLRDRLSAIEPGHNFIVTVRGHGLRLENQPG